METKEIVKVQLPQQLPMVEIMSISQAFAESGMFKDIAGKAQAMVKIVAGQEMGFPPFASMSGIHIIQGKPTVGAGLIASRVKGSGKYDYRVREHSDKICSIEFFEGGQSLGTETFTIEDAKRAGTQNLMKFPKNMLFARAISNGVKFYCPDIFSGPVYVPEEMQEIEATPPQSDKPVLLPTKKKIAKKAFDAGCIRIKAGELDIYQKMLDSFEFTPEQVEELETVFSEANLNKQ